MPGPQHQGDEQCAVLRKERVQDDGSGLAAAARGDLARIREIFRLGVTYRYHPAKGGKQTLAWDPTIVTDRHGSNALMWAAGGGHEDVCDFLITECGMDINTGNKVGRTAFHWAVRADQLLTCRWLVARGADPGLQMKDGSRALDWAMFFGALKYGYMCSIRTL
jgi:hypothetical protein